MSEDLKDERECADAGLRLCFVHVRLADVERTRKWIEIKANTLDDAVKTAEAMPDVEVCFEASFVPGGVVT